MMIQHIKKPKKLHLMWKDEHHHRHRVGELTEQLFRYRIETPEFKEAKQQGFKGYPAFPLSADPGDSYENPVPAFRRRCPPRQRSGFAAYLQKFGLEPDQEEVQTMTDFQLLAYTGAFIPGDPFNLAPSFQGVEPPFEFVLPVAGFGRRYRPELPSGGNATGEKLEISPEPDNPQDPRAIQVMLHGQATGYIPKGYLDSFHQWLENGQLKEAHVFKCNGDPGKPLLYAFVSVAASGS